MVPSLSSWTTLRTGLVALSATILSAIAILMYGRVGELHGAQVQLFVAIDGALGLIRGSDVWLDGQKVGTVKQIGLAAAGDLPPRTILSVTVLQSELNHFRTDSRASIKSGGSLLGTPVLFVLSGSTRGRALEAADTLIVPPATTLSAQIDTTMRRVPTILAGLRGVGSDMSSIFQDLNGYGRGPGLANQLQRLHANGEHVMAKVANARFADSTLMTSVARALADADSLRRELQSNALGMQKVRRDTSILTKLTAARNELARLQTMMASRDGTLGRLEHDTAIDERLRRAVQQINALMADVHKHPFRYIAF